MKKIFIFLALSMFASNAFGQKSYIELYTEMSMPYNSYEKEFTLADVFITADLGVEVHTNGYMGISIGYAPEMEQVSAFKCGVNYQYRLTQTTVSPFIRVGGFWKGYRTHIFKETYYGANIMGNLGVDIRMAPESSLFVGVGFGGDFFNGNNSFIIQPMAGLRFYFKAYK